MRATTKQKLEEIHDGILRFHDGRAQLLTIVLGAGNYINFLIQKGVIPESERNEWFEYIANTVYHRYKCNIPGANEGWVLFMEDLNDQYNEETIRRYKPYIS